MGQPVKKRSRICPLPSGPLIERPNHLRPRTLFMAVSLTFILTTSMMYYLMLPPAPLQAILPIELPPTPLQLTPHDRIAIDGDANFTATALLEGWPGDGSPENPFIIDGLDIFIEPPHMGHLISINNTQASFTISNCSLTGGCDNTRYYGAGIYLENVTNGELVNNICSRHLVGILLYGSSSNTVFNNTCTENIDGGGITLDNSDFNTIANNTCSRVIYGGGICLYASDYNIVEYNTVSNNFNGIKLESSHYNAVANNTCYSKGVGISLGGSDHNTVANNTCSNNDIGIYLEESSHNTLTSNNCYNNTIGIYLGYGCLTSNIFAKNTFYGNTERDIFVEVFSPEFGFRPIDGIQLIGYLGLMGFAGIIVLGAGWRMVKLSRVVQKGE